MTCFNNSLKYFASTDQFKILFIYCNTFGCRTKNVDVAQEKQKQFLVNTKVIKKHVAYDFG